MFINRNAELAHLEQLYQTNEAQMYILYGRRRVGKTELLRAFCVDKPHVFFVATLSSDADQLAAFSQSIWRFLYGQVDAGFTFPSWDAAFQTLATLPERPIVIIDEITYLIEGNKAIPSILQKVWDERLQTSKIFLVLCGSYVGIMEREILGYKAPLYGRRTGSTQLQPLSLQSSALFFPQQSPIEQIETWAVLGGMPYYLRIFDPEQLIEENIRQHILNTRGTLHNEPQLLLMEELREPRNYFSLLRAIAEGRRKLNEISQVSGLGDGRTAAKYLDVLRKMQIVEREVPVTERQPEKSRKGLYKIRDFFLRFWFRFVHPHQGALSLGLEDAILKQRVKPIFNQFVAEAFEEASQAHIAYLARTGQLPFLPERIGRWWIAQDEIDVVAISDLEQAVLFAECKWVSTPVGTDTLTNLQRKAQILTHGEDWQQVVYALFSKSGFTPALSEAAAEQNILLVEPNELVNH
ncbi:ATP-binding protein [Chloroflexi bacterium TSY]|nr:ATP-binding protein [Chloroflexi bacterium TSY]